MSAALQPKPNQVHLVDPPAAFGEDAFETAEMDPFPHSIDGHIEDPCDLILRHERLVITHFSFIHDFLQYCGFVEHGGNVA